jgi:hypothetical protein
MQRFDCDRKKAMGCPLQDYAPIVKSLVVLDDALKAKLKAKFEICYVLAKEGLAFVKYAPFHALADHQGVKLGQTYKTPDSAKVFTHFIAEAQRKAILLVVFLTQSLLAFSWMALRMLGTWSRSWF